MKKIRMNAAKLQLNKEKITSLNKDQASELLGGDVPTRRTQCATQCPIGFDCNGNTTTSVVPPVKTDISCTGCQLSLNPPGITTC